MIAQTYDYFCALGALDSLTTTVAIHHPADMPPEFIAAMNAFRETLVTEINRVEPEIKRMVARNLGVHS